MGWDLCIPSVRASDVRRVAARHRARFVTGDAHTTVCTQGVPFTIPCMRYQGVRPCDGMNGRHDSSPFLARSPVAGHRTWSQNLERLLADIQQ